MKVLLAAARHDYGDKSRGLSNEYYNLFLPLERVVDSVVLFDFMEQFQSQGRERMNHDLLEMVKRERPDVAIIVLHTDQVMPEVIDEVNRHTITVGYFFDDMWRVNFSRFWAKHFTWVTTSDVNGVRKFRQAGFSNTIFLPFACNHRIFVKKDLPKLYDVTFVGQYHPHRAWLLNQLKRAGIKAQIWGYKWGNGRLDQDAMVDVFNQSRINLNFSNCVSWDARYLLSSPNAVKDTLRALVKRDVKTHEQIKGRHFEINACGGFQLSYYVEGLERCYAIGEEMALYADPDDLVEKIRYYLKDEDERETVARRGYERTLTEHTMEKRFQQLLTEIRLHLIQ
ncbi:MAG: glycosyltransferase [Chloroflexi bacterium]|nr:glycosyltransferase [Chloroflexota bacterium]